ncbi:MAG: hypothetical protein AAFY17_12385, partial [Cyanobacteria bacterium J06642_11]
MKVLHKRRWITAFLFSLAAIASLAFCWHRAAALGPTAMAAPKVNLWGNRQVTNALQSGFAQANQAALMADRATTVDDWDQVVNA